MVLYLALLAAVGGAPADDSDDYRLVNPKAIELFETDNRLMDWALANFDKDHAGYLSIMEADEAARASKRTADGDGDGQVTPAEYRSARAFIVARFAATTRR